MQKAGDAETIAALLTVPEVAPLEGEAPDDEADDEAKEAWQLQVALHRRALAMAANSVPDADARDDGEGRRRGTRARARWVEERRDDAESRR